MLAILAPSRDSVHYLLSQVTVLTTRINGNATFYLVSYQDVRFLVIVSGYGKVNISRALTLAAGLYTITGLLVIGTAGSLGVSTPMFTAVIPTSAFQFDINFVIFCEPVATLPDMSTGLFDTDDTMRARALRAAQELDADTVTGVMATGDRFVASDCTRSELRRTRRAVAVDSECGSAGQAASLLQIPYAAVKVTCNDASCAAGVQYTANSGEAQLLVQRIALRYVALI